MLKVAQAVQPPQGGAGVGARAVAEPLVAAPAEAASAVAEFARSYWTVPVWPCGGLQTTVVTAALQTTGVLPPARLPAPHKLLSC